MVKKGEIEKEEEKMKKKKKKGKMHCCEKERVKKGAWTNEDDKILVDFITQNGHGNWQNLPKLAGLLRCGKSCRFRWTNYLRPGIKRGPFSPDEESTIIHLQGTLGNKWAAIASHLPGRTNNDIKNLWYTHLRKRLKSSKNLDWTSSSRKSVDDARHESPPSDHRSESDGQDFFLSLWSMEVGESFRNAKESTNGCDNGNVLFHSPSPQTWSLTKFESSFCDANGDYIDNQKVELMKCKKEVEDLAAYSDLLKSDEFDESSEAMLKLLLDFPMDGDEMEFIQDPIDDGSINIQG